MIGTTPYFILACVFAGAMGLVGLGILFARAENIERPNLVGGVTVLFALIAIGILWDAAQGGRTPSDAVAWSAIGLSLLGFAGARLGDWILGGRTKVHHDDATLGADLAD